MNSYAWRGPRGSGKRTLLLQHLAAQATSLGLSFALKEGTWFLSKPSGGTNADPDDDDAGDAGKSIPYEESALHIGFDVARMSMSDKLFLQTILPRWTGQQDVTLMGSGLSTRYLVLYHAHYLTDESVLQLQEALEQCSNLGILLTTELPVCLRLRDFCLDIPVSASASASADTEGDHLLATYVQKAKLPVTDVWRTFFRETAEAWSKPWTPQRVQEIRDWIYICLQRNLRWTDMVAYWMETIHGLDHLDTETKRGFYQILAEAEAGGGWMLVPSYRIPILWEAVQAKLARAFLAAAHPSAAA
jgi:hypothetical protein